MGKKFDEVKEFVHDHTIEIGYAVGVLSTIGVSVAACIIAKKKIEAVLPDAEEIMKNIKTPDEIPEKLVEFGVDYFGDYTDAVEVLTNSHSVSLKDLGKFGEALCDTANDISPESKAYVLINAMKTVDKI